MFFIKFWNFSANFFFCLFLFFPSGSPLYMCLCIQWCPTFLWDCSSFIILFFFLSSLDCILSWCVFCGFFCQPSQLLRVSYSPAGWLVVVLKTFKLVMFSPFTFGSVLCGLETIFIVQRINEFVLCSATDQRLRCCLSFCFSEGTTWGIYIVF